MSVVRTVLGDIGPELLGATDYHEHLFQVSPLLHGDELDDEPASTTEATLLRRSGASAVVDATPIGLGRRPHAVARISRASGLHVVHVTGVHREEHYRPGHPVLAENAETLADRFRTELLDAMPEDEDGRDAPGWTGTGPVRAGALKAGVGYWSMSTFERSVLDAVAGVSAETGAPVMVHLEHGSAAHEVLDVLIAAGCAETRVVLAHIDRNPDIGLHLELTARGAFLGYDGAARLLRWPDSLLVECIRAVVEAGGADHILLGGDVARRSRYVAYGGMPGLAYLFDRFVPRVRAAVGSEVVDRLLTANAARWLSWEPIR